MDFPGQIFLIKIKVFEIRMPNYKYNNNILSISRMVN